MEAISLALGSRADTSAIRTGADKAVVQLLGTLDGEEVVITREVSSSGKNLCKLNGEIVTLAQLNAVSRRLADIHGQYDNQSLLNPEYHITLLDMYKNDASAAKKAEVSVFFHKYHEIRQQLSSLLSQEKENARKQDFYRFEAAEIKKAALKPGEDAELEKRIFLLQNSEKIFENIEKTYTILFEERTSLACVFVLWRKFPPVPMNFRQFPKNSATSTTGFRICPENCGISGKVSTFRLKRWTLRSRA